MNRTLAIIPAKAYSSRLPHKNKLELAGHPLWLWSVRYAQQEGFAPVVYTDDGEIAHEARKAGATVIKKVCGDERDMSEVISHVMEHMPTEPDQTIVLLQPTSPLRKSGYAASMAAFHEMMPDKKVVYSARKMKRIGSHNNVFNVCYDDQHNDDWFYWFDGSVVVTCWSRFVKNNYQLFDETAVPLVNTEPCPLQVDTPDDLRMIRHLVQTDDRYLYESGIL